MLLYTKKILKNVILLSILAAIISTSSMNYEQVDHQRVLTKENEELFVFWMGMDTWSDILAWVFSSTRYICVLLIIIGCLVNGPTTNLGWTRLVRYVYFIYGTTYFLQNLIENSKDDVKGLIQNDLLAERSDFIVLYKKYYEKSEKYLFSFERWDISKDLVAITDGTQIKVIEFWDGRFYELVILGLSFLLGLVFLKGFYSVSQSSISHKFNSLRIAMFLALVPGCLGRALISTVIFYFWKNEYGAQMIGKDINIFHLASWIALAVVLLFDVITMIVSAFKDKKRIIHGQLVKEKSNGFFIFEKMLINFQEKISTQLL